MTGAILHSLDPDMAMKEIIAYYFSYLSLKSATTPFFIYMAFYKNCCFLYRLLNEEKILFCVAKNRKYIVAKRR